MKAIPVTLIIGAALIADGKTAGEIAAAADGDKDTARGSKAGRDFDSLASLGAKLGYETNGNMIVHIDTSFQEDCNTIANGEQQHRTMPVSKRMRAVWGCAEAQTNKQTAEGQPLGSAARSLLPTGDSEKE